MSSLFYIPGAPPKNAPLAISQCITSLENDLEKFRLQSLVALFLNIKYAQNKACILRNKVVMAVTVKHV